MRARPSMPGGWASLGQGEFLMLPIPLNLSTPRTWLRPAGAGAGEIACGVVIAGEVRWLRARLRGARVEFTEMIAPTTSPNKWPRAQPTAVSQAEQALRAELGRA